MDVTLTITRMTIQTFFIVSNILQFKTNFSGVYFEAKSTGFPRSWLFRYPQPWPPRGANGICKLCCGLNQLPSAIQLIKSEKRVDFHSFSRSKQFTSPQTFNKGTFSFLLLHLLMPVKSAKSQLRQKFTFVHKTRPEISHVALVKHTNNTVIISIHKTCLRFSLVCIPGRHHSLP